MEIEKRSFQCPKHREDILAHLWQLVGQGRGMEMRCAPGIDQPRASGQGHG